MTEETMIMRTVCVPLTLLREIERLRRTLNLSQPHSPDELLTRLLRLGLKELQKDAMLQGLQDYRGKSWRAEVNEDG